MWRLLKAMFTLASLVALTVAGIAWLSLSRAAGRAADSRLDERYLVWGGVRAGLLPPSAHVEKPMLKRGLLSAESVRFLLLPGAWTKRGAIAGAPRFDAWLLEVRLPKGAGCNCAAILDGRFQLPPWSRWRADEGRIVVEAGALAVEAEAVKASREEERLEVNGTVGERGTLALEGVLRDGFEGTLRAGPLEAAPLSAILVDPTRGRVIGGALSLDAKVTVHGSRITVRGKLLTDAIAIERVPGDSTPVERAIERGNARLAIELDVDVAHGADWAARIRESLTPLF